MVKAELRKSPDREMKKRMASMRGRLLARMKPVEGLIETGMTGLVEFGHENVVDEVKRAGLGKKVAKDPPQTKGQVASYLAASSGLLTEDVFDPIWNAIKSGVRSAHRRGLDDPLAILAGLTSLTDGSIRKATASAMHEAWGFGRKLAMLDIGLEEATLSCLLDELSCPECKRLDGTETKVNSTTFNALFPPIRPSGLSSGCSGSDFCRCAWIVT